MRERHICIMPSPRSSLTLLGLCHWLNHLVVFADSTGTAVYGTVRTVVWEDGGRKPSSYPIPKTFRNLLTERRRVSII
jgi:hypothetical protein